MAFATTIKLQIYRLFLVSLGSRFQLAKEDKELMGSLLSRLSVNAAISSLVRLLNHRNVLLTFSVVGPSPFQSLQYPKISKPDIKKFKK